MPETGSVSVSAVGLPAGVAPSVEVASGSYSVVVTAPETLTGLVPGTYTVTPQAVSLRRNVFDGVASSTTVTVSAGGTASDTVTYTVEPGDLWVTAYDTLTSSGSVMEYPASSLATTPVRSTTIGGLANPLGVAFDAAGNLWVANTSAGSLDEYLASPFAPGPFATFSTAADPHGVAFDADGNLWIGEFTASSGGTPTSGSVVELLASPYAPTTGATIGGMSSPGGVAFDSAGDLWVADPADHELLAYAASSLATSSPTGTPVSLGASSYPVALAFDAGGDLWVADGISGEVTEYLASSLATSPQAGTAFATSSSALNGLAFDVAGNLWIADGSSGQVVEYPASTLATTHATGTAIPVNEDPKGLAFDPPPYNLPLSR
jgi:sugar lactone lactonase YvrE